MGDFIAELRRRRVFRALVVYAVAAFAILQVVEPVMHGLHLPEWVLSFIVVLIGLGFPVTIGVAWAFDLKASGIERARSTEEHLGTPLRSRVRVWLLLLALAAVAAGTVFGLRWWLRGPPVPPSIAVLPFADLSPGKDQEYLSDGIAEEILTTLSRVDGLRIAGRTSSFYFKGKNARLADIGRELNVASVLDGGVRRDGNRIRVTATIVNVADGSQAWSESWDRDLNDILAVESEIAREVADAMKVRFLRARKPVMPDQPPPSRRAHPLPHGARWPVSRLRGRLLAGGGVICENLGAGPRVFARLGRIRTRARVRSRMAGESGGPPSTEDKGARRRRAGGGDRAWR